MTVGQSVPRLVKAEAGDYRTPDGRWRIVNPRLMDNRSQREWLIQEWDDRTGWEALDDLFPTLREARAELAREMADEQREANDAYI